MSHDSEANQTERPSHACHREADARATALWSSRTGNRRLARRSARGRPACHDALWQSSPRSPLVVMGVAGVLLIALQMVQWWAEMPFAATLPGGGWPLHVR